MACPRLSYRRRTHYATRSNRMKLVRTNGNKVVMQKRTKRSQGTHCPWVLGHKRLAGTKAHGHFKGRTAAKFSKTVSRPYGGVLTHDQLRDRIVRAFLIEEQRIVRKVVLAEGKFKRDKQRRDKKSKKRISRVKAAAKKVGVKKNVGKKLAPAAKKAAGPAKNKAPIGAKVVAKK